MRRQRISPERDWKFALVLLTQFVRFLKGACPMRPTKLPLLFFLSILLTVLCVHSTARADDNEGDEYDVNARVVRISLIKGDVNLKRHDSNDWETARLNLPLVEGDTLATGSDARAEIQIDSRNFVRLASDSAIKIITLRDDGMALSLAQGTASL